MIYTVVMGGKNYSAWRDGRYYVGPSPDEMEEVPFRWREADADYSRQRETASVGCRVNQIDPSRWEVHSASSDSIYVVRERRDGRLVCECPAATYHRSHRRVAPCRHIAAVVLSRGDPARLVEAIREDLLQEKPDIAHALALAEALARRALARA